jgi:hypothetical protein
VAWLDQDRAANGQSLHPHTLALVQQAAQALGLVA